MSQYAKPSITASHGGLPSRGYAWVVFALTFALMLSDYMSRQVLNAVFPLLKAEWMVSDAELGGLSSIVALTVGVLTFPLSLLADRWGRVRCLVLMALLWSVATFACGLAQTYQQMFLARFFIGVGEAAYGSVGLAVALSMFPASMRATITGAFMAGALFGSVLGIAGGGGIAGHFGWRTAFFFMASFGLVFTLIYPFVVRERKGMTATRKVADVTERPLRQLFTNPVLLCLYAGSGLQIFLSSALMAWTPTFMERYYGMSTARAGVVAAALVLCGGVGMIVLGVASDRVSRRWPFSGNTVRLAMLYCALSALALFVGFALPAGKPQLLLVGIGFFFATGIAGPTGSLVTRLCHASVTATALAVMTLANNILGLAPGPFVIGALADHVGLRQALGMMPLVSLAAIGMYQWAAVAWRRSGDAFPPTFEAMAK